MTIPRIYSLIATPLPRNASELKDHIDVLSSRSSPIISWPPTDSPLENVLLLCVYYVFVPHLSVYSSLLYSTHYTMSYVYYKAIFWCAAYNYMHPGSMEMISLLKHSMSATMYFGLSSLLSVVASTQKWIEFNPDGIYPISVHFYFILYYISLWFFWHFVLTKKQLYNVYQS